MPPRPPDRTSATRERIYAYVQDRLRQGDPPTVREIRDAVGLRAVQSVQVHLDILRAEGRLQAPPVSNQGRRRARSVRLPGTPAPAAMVPLLGRVQAGTPTWAAEDADGFVPVSGRASPEGLFALRVRGDSMRDAGILDGDVVLVRRGVPADDGDVVVALVDDEATVKTLRRGAAGPELHPANPAFAVIKPPPALLTLLGRVVEVRRVLEAG